jgi:hypothetical protein
MIAAQIADVAVGDIDDRRGDTLGVPILDFDDFVENLGLFALQLVSFRLLDLLKCHFLYSRGVSWIFQMRQAGAQPIPSKAENTLHGLAGAVNFGGEKFCISEGGGTGPGLLTV